VLLSWLAPIDIGVGAFRWLEYAGLVGFVGVVVVRRLAGLRPHLPWARPSMQPALTAALVGGLGVMTASAIRDGHLTAVLVVRVIAEGVALILCVYVHRWVVPAAIVAVAALPFAGHASQMPSPGGAMFADIIHVLAAGTWAGGILVLATLHPPAGWGGAEGRALLERFGRIAFLAFAVTALTGVLRATSQLHGLSDLWTTEYGLVLSAKTAGVGVMVAMSALMWRRGSQSARYEGLVVLFVLAATAVLAVSPVYPGQG
jgi:putative copper export protein